LLPLGIAAIKCAKQMLRVPRALLMPIILLFCIVGSFAINNSLFGVLLMLVFGVLAWLMEENGFPVAPAILGLVLGAMLEEHFITSMIKADGRLLGFFERPIAAGLALATFAVLLWPLASWLWRRHLTRPDRQS
jgi:TctA family transporter